MRFDFNSSDESKIQGYCFETPADTESLTLAKRARSHMDAYRDNVRNLTSDDFEAICRGVLILLGCKDPVLTPHSDDQGIDVFGELSLRGKLGLTYELGGPDARMAIWIVGQAKKYTIAVQPSEIREFIGSVELLKHRIFSGSGAALARFEAKPYQPNFLFFLTTGRLSQGARETSDQAGVIVLDESDISALLADHRVATVADTYWTQRFTDWVSANAAA